MGFFKKVSKGIGNVVGNITGTTAANNANKAINNQNINFQSEQNSIMREREDNAIQRRSADLEKAGINRLLAGNEGANASGGLGAPAMIPNMAADASKMIANIGGNITQDILNLKTAKKAEADAKSAIVWADYTKLQSAEKAATMQNVIESWELKNEQTKAEINSILTDVDAAKSNMLLQAVQRKALLTTTDKTEKEIEQIKIETIKAAKMVNLIEAQVKTEAFKQSESSMRIREILQNIRTDKVKAEAMLKDIEKVTQDMEIDEINLKHLNSDKWADKISKYSGAFRDLMMGLNLGLNSAMDISGRSAYMGYRK